MTINLLELHNVPILEQLQMEEALLRTNEENWCIINTNAPKSIVMGISADPKEVVNLDLLAKKPIPLIRRFSGGGTVVVDENTIFVSFIFQKDVHDFSPFPKTILQWTGEFYKKALQIPSFAVRDNDYALLDKKIGGNAQYIRKNRWLHHTTFLWDYALENMNYLLHPPTEPTYRKSRPHHDFLTTLKPLISKEGFLSKITVELEALFSIKRAKPFATYEDHRRSTTLVYES